MSYNKIKKKRTADQFPILISSTVYHAFNFFEYFILHVNRFIECSTHNNILPTKISQTTVYAKYHPHMCIYHMYSRFYAAKMLVTALTLACSDDPT